MSFSDQYIQILGAYGTKFSGYGTSAFLLNDSNTIDAGNLLKPLKERSVQIEHIWMTHSHLDHISDIAFILDNYYAKREKTLHIHGLPPTIKAIRKHFLNDLIWPDFSTIPMHNSTKMCIEYHEIEFDQSYQIGDGETLRPFKTDHAVPSCGYVYKKDQRGILITADTYSIERPLEILEGDTSIKAAVIECSFPSSMEKLAKDSKHLTPKLLFEMLEDVKRRDFTLYINHIKPIFYDKMVEEIMQMRGEWEPIILQDEDFLKY